MTRYVIVGMGIAGIAAALALRETDPSGEITLVCDDRHEYYSRPGLAYYLTGEIPERQLYPFDPQDWKALNAYTVKAHAIKADPKSHRVELKNASQLSYDRLLLATGAESVSLNIAGEELNGVVKLDNLEDARQIISASGHNKTAVVIGGGVTSLELIEGLLCCGVKIHYFLRGDRYWANVLDEMESQIIQNRLVHDGVHLHFRTEIAEILGRNGKVSGVRTKAGETLPCSMVGACIGVRPRVELARSAGLDVDRGIMANEYMQTSDPDIYTAGDCAQVYDPHTKRSIVDSLWTPGRTQGRTAALNMAGRRQTYQRKADFNVLRLTGIMISIIGAVGSGRDADLVSVARGSSEAWLGLPNSISTETGNEINHLRLLVGERTLLGGVVLGDQKLSMPLQEMVGNQIDITPIRTQLLQAGPGLGQVILDYWNHVRERG